MAKTMTRSLKPRQIEAFRSVMILGSASAAAESMFISQPAVSRLLADLEESVGFSLFERQRRGLVPTADAKRLYKAVERVYLGVESIQDTARLIKEGDVGKVRVAALPIYAEGLLAESVGQFLSINPGIHIELESADRDDLLAGLQAQRFDLAISTIPVKQKGIDEFKLGDREALCILPVGHPLTRSQTIPLKKLREHAFVGLSGANPFRQVIEQIVKHVGGATNEVATTRTQRAAALMVQQGAGISIVDPDIYQYLNPELVTTRPLDPAIHWEFGILSPSQISLTVAAAKFADYCIENIS